MFFCDRYKSRELLKHLAKSKELLGKPLENLSVDTSICAESTSNETSNLLTNHSRCGFRNTFMTNSSFSTKTTWVFGCNIIKRITASQSFRSIYYDVVLSGASYH